LIIAVAMFQSILIPTDLSDDLEQILGTAAALAAGEDAAVFLLHVIEVIQDTSYDELKSFYERLEKQANEKLCQAAERFHASSIPCKTEVAYGDRLRQVLEYASSNNIEP